MRSDREIREALTRDEKRRLEEVAQGALMRRPFAQVASKPVRWLLHGLIPLKTLTLLAGVGGLGKSTWAMGIAARVSRGDLAGGGDVLVISAEDTLAEILRPRLEAAQGNLDRVHEIGVSFDGGGLVVLPDHLGDLAEHIRQVEARLVIIDPIVAMINVDLDAYKDQHVRVVLGQLAQIADATDCAIVIVGHLNKAPANDAYLRVANSAAFWNAARSVVLITPDPEEPEEHRVVTQMKANYARLAPLERHVIEEVLLDNGVITTSRMTFVEAIHDLDRADVLTAVNRQARDTKVASAVTFLAGALADGEWHDSAGLKILAGAQEISERTLKRAKDALGAEHESRDYPATTYWRLPRTDPERTLAQLGQTQLGQGSPPEVGPTMAQLEISLNHAPRAHVKTSGPSSWATVGPQLGQPLGKDPGPTVTSPSSPDCLHLDEWLAKDGRWRCVRCEPPHWPAEVRDRRRRDEDVA